MTQPATTETELDPRHPLVRLGAFFDDGAFTTITPVDDRDYQVPFKFTGTIDKITIRLEPPVLSAEDVEMLKKAELKQAADE